MTAPSHADHDPAAPAELVVDPRDATTGPDAASAAPDDEDTPRGDESAPQTTAESDPDADPPSPPDPDGPPVEPLDGDDRLVSEAGSAVRTLRERPLTPVPVTAVLVLRDGMPWLPTCLDALAAQTISPHRIVVVDVASTDGSADLVTAHSGLAAGPAQIHLIRTTGVSSFAEAVAAAAGAGAGAGGVAPPTSTNAAPASSPAETPSPAAGHEWLWVLRDDCAPDPGALEALTSAAGRSPSVRVAGPKVVEWDHPKRLLDVGHQLTRSGRRIFAPAPGEADQGQYDRRTDVIAVSMTGALVRRDVFDSLGGLDPGLPDPADSLDFGWRAQLAGHRVVVVPAARVRDAGARFGSHRSTDPDPASVRRAQRSATRRVALARCSLAAMPFLALWIAVSSIASALGLLLLKRPAHAWLALGDLTSLAHPLSSWRARWRFRRRRVLARRDLATLFVTPGEAARHTWDKVQEALTPGRPHHHDTIDDTETETGPVAPEADNLAALPKSLVQRVLTNPGFLATVAAAAAAVYGFRSSIRQGLLDASGSGLAGGELERVITDAAGLWHVFRDGWHGASWGTSLESSPAVALLAGLTWVGERLPAVGQGRSPAAVMVAWLVVAALPMATLTAYVASRVLPVSRWVRAMAALAWGCSGVAMAAVHDGRVTAAASHVLVPLVIAGIVRTAREDGTFTAASATALGAGVLAALSPVMLIPVAVTALILVIVGPGWHRRARALALLVFPPALQGPWLLHLAHDPVAWLGAPGLVDVLGRDAVPTWHIAAGMPDGGAIQLLALAAPVSLLATIAMARRTRSTTERMAAVGLGLLVVLGTAYAVAARGVVVGSVSGDAGAATLSSPATPWPGVGTQLALAGLLGLGLLGSRDLGRLVGRSGWGWRRWALGVALSAAGLAYAAGVGWAAYDRLDGTLSADTLTAPAVAIDQAAGPDRNRMLVLTPTPDRLIYEVVGSEPPPMLRSVVQPPTATDPGVAAIVQALGSASIDPARPIGGQLADLAVGFVSVRGGTDLQIIRTLDATPGVVRLGATDDQTLWRVVTRPSATQPGEAVPPARVRITTADGHPITAIRTTGPHAQLSAAVPAGPAGRLLVVAEAPEWARAATVTFNGQILTPIPGHVTPSYALPQEAGSVAIDIPPVRRGWSYAQLVIVALVVFLAVPFGNRRSRRVS
ncbi:MAG TPA: glycosyltransferase [Dermatophilaceae bacterium]|nr:glycosyltransferase [Dermatophilaceae bacterium]